MAGASAQISLSLQPAKHGDPFPRTTTRGVWSKSVARYMTHKEKLWSGPQLLFPTLVHLSKKTFSALDHSLILDADVARVLS